MDDRCDRDRARGTTRSTARSNRRCRAPRSSTIGTRSSTQPVIRRQAQGCIHRSIAVQCLTNTLISLLYVVSAHRAGSNGSQWRRSSLFLSFVVVSLPRSRRAKVDGPIDSGEESAHFTFFPGENLGLARSPSRMCVISARYQSAVRVNGSG